MEHRPYREVVLADRPVGYWRLDEKSGNIAHDSSGNHHDGTIGARVVLGKPGLISDVSASPEFTGADKSSLADDIRIPRDKLLEIEKTLTIEAWVYGYDMNIRGHNSGDVTLVAYGNDTAADRQHCRYGLELDEHSHVLHFPLVVNGRFTDPPTGPRSLLNYLVDNVMGDKVLERELYGASHSSINPPENKRLYYLVGTYDGQTARFYVDGKLNNTMHVRGRIEGYRPDNGMGIGGEFADVNPTFHGRIAEVAVYNRTLTAEQIARHFAAGSASPSVAGAARTR